MPDLNYLAFLVEPLGPGAPDTLAINPLIDFTPLTRRIEAYEREKAFDVVGGYVGIVPLHHQFGPLNCHYLADSFSVDLDSDWQVFGRYLLGCKCGEVTCWPLTARIRRADDTIIWDQFYQPHRKDRDYAGFGPFHFDYDQYESVVNRLAERFYPK